MCGWRPPRERQLLLILTNCNGADVGRNQRGSSRLLDALAKAEVRQDDANDDDQADDVNDGVHERVL